MPITHRELRGDHVVLLTLEGESDLNLGVVNEALYHRLTEFRDDATLRCAVVVGAGTRAFSAGGDLKAMPASAEGRPQRNPWTGRIIDLLTGPGFHKPVIAAVNGHAVGQGMVLALACDLRIAADTASFSLPEVRYGWAVLPEVARLLLRSIPPGPALEILLTGDRVSTAQAAAWGLVNRVVAGEALVATAVALAERIAGHPPEGVQALRAMVARLQSEEPRSHPDAAR